MSSSAVAPPSDRGVPDVVVLPRAGVRQVLARARHGAGAVAFSRLVLQRGWSDMAALAGPLRFDDAAETDVAVARLPGIADDGAVLVAAGQAALRAPADGADAAAWESWLLAHAPPLRRVSNCAQPTVVVVCLSTTGVHAAMARMPAQRGPRWLVVPTVALSGDAWQRLATDGRTTTLPAAEFPAAGHDRRGRFSRVAGALGPHVLERLQRSTIAVVGLGVVGSVLVHDLARIGVRRVIGLDPAVAAPADAIGDLAPGSEGRPLADALRRYLAMAMPPPAGLDLRSLAVDSPVAGALLAEADLLVCAADDAMAVLWAQAWGLALNRTLVALGLSMRRGLAAGHVALLPAGAGCIACAGAGIDPPTLVRRLRGEAVGAPCTSAEDGHPMTRSWAALVAHLGMRAIERHAGGQRAHASWMELRESEDGAPSFVEHRPSRGGAAVCRFCVGFAGVGTRNTTPARLLECLLPATAP